MKILYIGDVMGEMGMRTVREVLPRLRQERGIDIVIAQSENVTEGRGIIPLDYRQLREMGVDFCTGGNWSTWRPEIYPLLNDPQEPIVRPANYPKGTSGLGYKYITLAEGKVLVISLLGHVVGRDAEKPTDNPLHVIDQILESQSDVSRIATVVNFHGDYSSEKVVVGHYLDGRVSAVIGDHWHVPTADARVLPDGTAHITDVGMCGALNSSLGIGYDSVIPRWRDDRRTQNKLATTGERQFNALEVLVNSSGLAETTEHIQLYI